MNDRTCIYENLARVRGEIYQAAVKAGRDPADIKIVAVTKRVPVEVIRQALLEGIDSLGENRVQELLDKQPHFEGGVDWHLIGHLQTNKVKAVVGRISLLHSMDSWRLAIELDRRSREAGVITRVLVQVNLSGEKTKFGLAPADTKDFINEALGLKGISIKGLMTVAPLAGDPEEVRPVFRDLRLLSERITKEVSGSEMSLLSMGMTQDYRVAVEEGANILRIGTGIFSERN